MTHIINRMNGYDKEKDQNNNKKAASTLMVMMSGKRGETSNAKEELVCNKIDDANNCKAVAKQTNNNIEHDRNCVVEVNTGEMKGVDINDEGGTEVDNEFDIDSLYNQGYGYADIDGTVNGLIME